MLTVEDALEELQNILWDISGPFFDKVITNTADAKFIADVAEKTKSNNRISTKQSFIVLKLLANNASLFKHSKIITIEAINRLCENPCYRLAPYQSIEIPREVRFLGHRRLGFKMKFSAQLIERIRAFKDPFEIVSKGLPTFNSTYRIWIVEVTEHNLSKIMKFISKAYFNFDDPVVEFLQKCELACETPSSIEVTNDAISLVINNNELLCAWAEQVLEIEEQLNVHTD
jgi:hypothetical protein